MFIVEIHQPGIQVDPIKQVNGSLEFCQEFFDDVRLPAHSVIGDVNDGWSVAQTLLAHERNAVGGGSPYVSGRNYLAEGADGARDTTLTSLVTALGTARDPVARQLVAEAHVLDVVQRGLVQRVHPGHGQRRVARPGRGHHQAVQRDVGRAQDGDRVDPRGADAVTWPAGEEITVGRDAGEPFLQRQALCLAGGSNEIQRNIIAERVLGMPREWAADRDVPYKDVRRKPIRPTAPR